MTLITHFRTEKYAVVASDSMQTNTETGKVKQSQKIYKFGEDRLIATYGNVFNKADAFIKKEKGSIDKLKSILNNHEDKTKKGGSTPGIGCLMVSKDKSTLLSKWYIMLDSLKPLYTIELNANKEFNYPEGNDEIVKDLKTICSNPVFFNEILAFNGIRNIDRNWYSDIIKCFNGSLPETEFNLTSIKDIAVILEIVIEFYMSVYKNKNLHQDIIGGNIWLSYIEIETGEIHQPTVIYEKKINTLSKPKEYLKINTKIKKIGDDCWDNTIDL